LNTLRRFITTFGVFHSNGPDGSAEDIFFSSTNGTVRRSPRSTEFRSPGLYIPLGTDASKGVNGQRWSKGKIGGKTDWQKTKRQTRMSGSGSSFKEKCSC
ncbi:hypothetical protein BaRGS_00015618, partial [Batillaria attramentaria]